MIMVVFGMSIKVSGISGRGGKTGSVIRLCLFFPHFLARRIKVLDTYHLMYPLFFLHVFASTSIKINLDYFRI